MRRGPTSSGGGTDESGTWRNWTGDQTCRPATIERPRTEGEITALLEKAELNDRIVRAAGAGHSFSDAVLTDGMLLSLQHMDRLLDVDTASGLARVEAGMTLHELNLQLARHGRALENLGDVDVQSVAGATATGTHGTGVKLRNISHAIHSARIVTADGTVVEVEEDVDADAWRAARVSLGSLGIVTELTLRTIPAFTLRGVDRTEPLEDVFDKLDDLVDSNEHFEFYTFPHSPLALTRTNNRVDDDPRPRSKSRAWMHDVVLVNYAFEAVCRVGRRWPKRIPALNRMSARLAGSSERIEESYRIFASPRLVRFTEMEYAIPRAHAVEAVRAVRAVVEERGLPVSFPMEVRFLAEDDAFLGPAYGRETCCISLHVFHGMEWEPYFRAVEEIMDDFDGRPHWGKRHFKTAGSLRERYPEWDRFAQVRARFDPNGRFANAYLERVLGPITRRP
ncbi:MAG: FAD-binding protein [Actinomycetota bacterium]|nr:FAD-binding protein [Actinomycetota bacterium]